VIAAELLDDVEAARMKGGEGRLGTREELRRRFGVSLATLGQALRLLEGQGLVETRTGPGGGVFASRPGQELLVSNLVLGFRHGTGTVEEALAVRAMLEPFVARQAARSRAPSDEEALRRSLAVLEQAVGDPAAYLRANWDLHRAIANVCGNQVLRTLYVSVLHFVEQELVGARPGAGFPEEHEANFRLHAALVEAIVAGDADAAAARAAHHAPVRHDTRRVAGPGPGWPAEEERTC
jgi:DNA-binding FadR family transcriptional regulator